VFCSNDGLAIELLQAALLLGLRVPEDLCVVGFDNVPMAAWPAFDLTTIDYPIASLIDAIMASIERERTDPEVAGKIERVQTRLIVRRTTPTGSASILRAHDQGNARP
jgi:DNA-binding LacI/PurR family transcriptional regulator